MKGNLKVLGLAFVAVLALGAIGAQAATAAMFHADEENVVVTGEATNTQTLTIGSAAVKCTEIGIEGTQTGVATEGSYTAESVTVHPTYSGSASGGEECDSFIGNETATVNTHECHYKLYAETNGEGKGAVDIECPEGQAIEITASTCVIKIGSQTGLNGVHYVNNGTETSEKDITAESQVEGIHYTSNGKFTCTLAGVGSSGTNAVYEGNATVKAYEDLSTPGTTGSYEMANQVGIWKE